MKKVFLLLAILLGISECEVRAQVMSPYYANYNGPGRIFYAYGFYQGFVSNGFAHGQGTFYWNDGSIFYGSFYGGYQNGPGVLISRLYGYIAGCWFNGNFLGACQTGITNPYTNTTTVQNIVHQVHANKPDVNPNNNQTLPSYDPSGYRVVQISAQTELGQSLLGSYQPALQE